MVARAVELLAEAAMEATGREAVVAEADRRWPTQASAFREAGFKLARTKLPSAWEVVD